MEQVHNLLKRFILRPSQFLLGDLNNAFTEILSEEQNVYKRHFRKEQKAEKVICSYLDLIKVAKMHKASIAGALKNPSIDALPMIRQYANMMLDLFNTFIEILDARGKLLAMLVLDGFTNELEFAIINEDKKLEEYNRKTIIMKEATVGIACLYGSLPGF